MRVPYSMIYSIPRLVAVCFMEDELDHLLAAFGESAEGRGSAWLIAGESGVGKSRLLDEIRTQAMVHGGLVMRGQALGEGQSPYQVWRSVFRWLALLGAPDDVDIGLLKRFVPDMPLLAEIIAARPCAWWLEALERAGVPCGPINGIDQALADPQVQARGMTVTMNHPLAGPIGLLGSPLKLSETPVTYRHPPPTLGEHTEEVLRDWLGEGAQGDGRWTAIPPPRALVRHRRP